MESKRVRLLNKSKPKRTMETKTTPKIISKASKESKTVNW